MQNKERKIYAFTEMTEESIKTLENKMLNIVKEKVLKKKMEEGEKDFDPDDYNVPIERRLIFNIDSMIRLEGVFFWIGFSEVFVPCSAKEEIKGK